MWARAFCTVLPCGSRTAFFGVMMILAFIASGRAPIRRRNDGRSNEIRRVEFLTGWFLTGLTGLTGFLLILSKQCSECIRRWLESVILGRCKGWRLSLEVAGTRRSGEAGP